MKGQKMATLAAIAGILGGVAAIAGGFIAHSKQPVFGIPQFFGVHWQYFSGVHMLLGIGLVMVIGGLVTLKWPSVGVILVCLVAMAGLVYTFNRGQYRWTPLLYYWLLPWLLAWVAGILGGYAVYQNVPQIDEKLHDARPNHSTT